MAVVAAVAAKEEAAEAAKTSGVMDQIKEEAAVAAALERLETATARDSQLRSLQRSRTARRCAPGIRPASVIKSTAPRVDTFVEPSRRLVGFAVLGIQPTVATTRMCSANREALSRRLSTRPGKISVSTPRDFGRWRWTCFRAQQLPWPVPWLGADGRFSQWTG